MRSPCFVVAPLALLLAACSATPETTPDEATTGADSSLDATRPGRFERVVWARMYIGDERYVTHFDAEQIGNHLASFCPSYVAGLVRINSASFFDDVDPDVLSHEIDEYRTVRKIVRAANPHALFDVHLSGSSYATWNGAKTPLEPVLEAVKARLSPDAVFFDFFTCDGGALCDTRPEVMAKAIAWGRCELPEQQGTGCKRVLVGGNYLSATTDRAGTQGADFYAMVDSGKLTLDKDRIEMLHGFDVPVLVHVNNNPQNSPDAASCLFMNPNDDPELWHWQDRADYETKRAMQQHDASPGHDRRYHLMYNLFFPSCVPAPWDVCCTDGVPPNHPECAEPHSCLGHQRMYDATKDVMDGRTMAQHMRKLAHTYNVLDDLPATCNDE